MSYSKYYIYKEEVSTDGGSTWQYTGNETPSGESIGTYDTLEECKNVKKYILTTRNGEISSDCDGSIAITQSESRYFPNVSILYAVDIGECVSEIGYHAFYCCTSLSSVTMPDSVVYIDDVAFGSCNLSMLNSNVNGICNLPKYLNYIGNGAFAGSRFTKINIPNSVAYIGGGAFASCRSLTSVGPKGSGASVEIPNNITSLSNELFKQCGGLTNVNIPTGVTTIGDYAFWMCSGLTSVNIPDSVISIGNCAFLECSGITSVTIPDSVTSIGNRAFARCSGITSCTIGSCVTSINESAFTYCRSITNIDIPDSVTSIGGYAFHFCTSLTSCTIGSGVTTIGQDAFYYCNHLTSITINATTPPTLGGDTKYVFADTNNCPIYVPAESVDAYKSDWWRYKSRIQAIP